MLANKLAKLRPNIIMLQEVIVKSDRIMLEKKLGELGYESCFKKNARVRTGGIIIFSKLTIESCDFEKYKVQGSPIHLVLGDRLIKKGYLSMTVKINGIVISVINTHLIYNYLNSEFEERSVIRQTR